VVDEEWYDFKRLMGTRKEDFRETLLAARFLKGSAQTVNLRIALVGIDLKDCTFDVGLPSKSTVLSMNPAKNELQNIMEGRDSKGGERVRYK